MPDVHGSLRGKLLTGREFDETLARGWMPLGDLLLALDPLDHPITTLSEFGSHRGCPDLLVRPELETLREFPITPGWGICLGTPLSPGGHPYDLAPRVLCDTLLQQARETGATVRASFEYEFRVTTATGQPATSGLSYHLAETARLHDLVEPIASGLEALGAELLVVHAEGGRGLVEANIAALDGIRAADAAFLFRSYLKSFGRTRGLDVTFLAKPIAGEEGQSGHLHLSLWRDGQNLFAPANNNAAVPPDPLLHSVAGLLEHLPAGCLVYNPTINSYKRVVPGYFAPMNASWGIDNRLAAVRVLLRGPHASRVELRRPGADANPYLVLAAAVASILDGLARRATPPPPFHDDPTNASPPRALPLPRTLESALRAFEANVAFRGILGESFCRYFATTREWEISAWQEAVTEWERERYAGIG